MIDYVSTNLFKMRQSFKIKRLQKKLIHFKFYLCWTNTEQNFSLHFDFLIIKQGLFTKCMEILPVRHSTRQFEL